MLIAENYQNRPMHARNYSKNKNGTFYWDTVYIKRPKQIPTDNSGKFYLISNIARFGPIMGGLIKTSMAFGVNPYAETMKKNAVL